MNGDTHTRTEESTTAVKLCTSSQTQILRGNLKGEISKDNGFSSVGRVNCLGCTSGWQQSHSLTQAVKQIAAEAV